MGNELDHRPPDDPKQVISRDDGWFIVGPDGGDLAGPFATLDDVEDYLDSREAHAAKPPLPQPEPQVKAPPNPVASRPS